MALPSINTLLVRLLAAGGLTVALAGCPHSASLPVEAGMGPNPELVPPRKETIPTVHIAPARGWPDGQAPVAAPGLVVTRFAEGLDHPRWLHVLPNGDVLVAESNAPERPARKGLKVWITGLVMKRAGAAVPSADRITLLRDADGDGVAEVRSPFLSGLKSPFGMALLGDYLFIANTDAVVRVPYVAGDLRSRGAEVEKVTDLPAGPRNHHWTKDLIAHPDGQRLFATVGSNSNVAEHGMHEEVDRASVLEIDLASRRTRVFASGLRNPNGLAWNPVTRQLWVAVNERDELGGDLVPDYMTSVRENGFYGWPYSYFGQHVDERVQPSRPDLVASAIKPDYALGSHTASLGLTFHRGGHLGEFRDGAFVGQHGSWNRRPRSGYKVIFVPFQDGKPAGAAVDVLTGFIDEDGHARGRPVGVAIDRRGALLVADDVGNVVWRVSGTAAADAPATASPASTSATMR